MPPSKSASSRKRTPATSPPPPLDHVSTPPPSPPSDDASVLYGLTDNGRRFEVPPTRDTLGMLCRISELPTLVTWAFMLLTLRLALPDEFMGYPVLRYFGYSSYSSEYLLIVAVFWRLMYNVVLGIILDKQSRSQFITNYIRAVSRHPTSASHAVLRWLLRGTVGCDSLNEKPAQFNAWVLNTQLVNVILPNDVFAFSVFALREWNLLSYDGWVSYFDRLLFKDLSIMDDRLSAIFYTTIYIISVALICSSIWSKMLSHEIIGYYAWFWGDFFFKIDKTLKFDGIFEVFPHPMYTVGYAWMYGASMMSGSFQVLGLAMFSHIMQMLFLAYVENPHIERTYGLEFEESKTTHRETAYLFHNFDLFRASDWTMVVLFLFAAALTIVCERLPDATAGYPYIKYAFLANAIISTVVCKCIIACLLYRQSKTKFWTNHFLKQGLSEEAAFEEWKRVQNMLNFIVNMSYGMLAWFMFSLPSLDRLHAAPWMYLCTILLAIMLLGVSYWVSSETYSALGDYGWFYGDFFLSPQHNVSGGYIVRGIYRYFNNPDFFFGKFWLYAIALLCGDRDVASVAMLHHAIAYVQLIAIEEPYVKSLYKVSKRFDVRQTLTKLKRRGGNSSPVKP